MMIETEQVCASPPLPRDSTPCIMGVTTAAVPVYILNLPSGWCMQTLIMYFTHHLQEKHDTMLTLTYYQDLGNIVWRFMFPIVTILCTVLNSICCFLIIHMCMTYKAYGQPGTLQYPSKRHSCLPNFLWNGIVAMLEWTLYKKTTSCSPTNQFWLHQVSVLASQSWVVRTWHKLRTN